MESKVDNVPLEEICPKSLPELFDLSEAQPRDSKRLKIQDPTKDDLTPVSNEKLQEQLHDKYVEHTGDSEEHVDFVRRKREDGTPKQTARPEESDISQGAEAKHETVILSTSIPITRRTKRQATINSDNIEGTRRHHLPQSPEEPVRVSPINWLSPKIPAAEIRRECAFRVPPIRIPTRMVAKEVKSKYGAMLMELDKEKEDTNLILEDECSQTEEAKKEDIKSDNESFATRDSASTLGCLSPDRSDVETVPLETHDNENEQEAHIVEEPIMEMHEESEKEADPESKE